MGLWIWRLRLRAACSSWEVQWWMPVVVAAGVMIWSCGCGMVSVLAAAEAVGRELWCKVAAV